ncbi:hypothetical protein NMY22_g7471 [Coprinellus aureogranulatus]|nr:hypothetical protein NMY22_g7471 [Coprinellus aureogranulatus]
MAPAAGREPFTEKDIEHLSKYLAVYAPSNGEGRLGNKLYQTLVANAGGRWPWSRRHPWQSWREHYKKNTAMYDRKIRKYQREKGLLKDDYFSRSAERPTGSKRKASGTLEELKEAKRPKPSSNAKAGPSKPRTHQSLFTDSEDEVVPATQSQEPPPTQHRREEQEESTQESMAASKKRRAEDIHEEPVTDKRVTEAGQVQDSSKLPSTSSQRPSPEKPGTSTARASSSAKPTGNPQPQPTMVQKPKPRLLPRKRVDDDPFISSPAPSPPASQPPPSSPSRKQPPKYVEGPFRNTLSTANSTWPPSRHKTQQPKLPAPSTTPAPGSTTAEAMPPPPVQVPPTTNGAPSSKPKPKPLPSPASSIIGPKLAAQKPVVANATPSSSKDRLPPGNYKSIDEVIGSAAKTPVVQTKPPKIGTPASAQSAHGSAKRNPAPVKIASILKQFSQPSHPNKDSVEYGKGANELGKNKDSRPIPASRSFPQVNDKNLLESPLYRAASEGQAKAHEDEEDYEDDDVFTAKKAKPEPPKERSRPPNDLRRQLHVQQTVQEPIPHLNLKEVAASAASRSRRQSSLSTASKTSSERTSVASGPSLSTHRRDSLNSLGSRRTSRLHDAPLRDVELLQEAGLKATFKKMAKKYGFHIDVVSEAYDRFKDLDKTHVFLNKLRLRADQAGKDLLNEMINGDDRDGDSEDEERENKATQRRREEPEATSSAKPAPRRSKGPRPSLTIRPIPDEEVEKHALTVEEYSPPRRSRAGRYSRKSGSLPTPGHIMPYLQTPGTGMGRGRGSMSQEMSSPPRIDLRSSSPLKGRKSMDLESLPPSSPPEEGEDGEEDDEDEDENEVEDEEQEHDDEDEDGAQDEDETGGGDEEQEDDDEDEDEDEDDDLEDKYEDLFSGSYRPTSPEEVEDELFQERFLEDDAEDEYPDANLAMDMDTYMGQDDDEDENDHNGDNERRSPSVAPPDPDEGVPETDNDTNLADEDESDEDLTDPKKVFARLPPAQQEIQRQMARFANTINRQNRHEMAAWEAELDKTIGEKQKLMHRDFLLQTMLVRLREGVEKPLRLDEYYDEALEES